MRPRFQARHIVEGALIGALYVVLTLLAQPISFGLLQVRISEALCVLPFFTFSAVPGLFVGCLLANLLGGAVIYDVIFGSLATLLAAALTYYFAKKGCAKWLVPLPPILANALVVGAILTYVYEVGVPYWTSALYVGLGEAIACYVLGIPLMLLLSRYRARLFAKNGREDPAATTRKAS